MSDDELDDVDVLREALIDADHTSLGAEDVMASLARRGWRLERDEPSVPVKLTTDAGGLRVEMRLEPRTPVTNMLHDMAARNEWIDRAQRADWAQMSAGVRPADRVFYVTTVERAELERLTPQRDDDGELTRFTARDLAPTDIKPDTFYGMRLVVVDDLQDHLDRVVRISREAHAVTRAMVEWGGILVGRFVDTFTVPS